MRFNLGQVAPLDEATGLSGQSQMRVAIVLTSVAAVVRP
jgi:hypothetical protein